MFGVQLLIARGMEEPKIKWIRRLAAKNARHSFVSSVVRSITERENVREIRISKNGRRRTNLKRAQGAGYEFKKQQAVIT